VTKDERQSAFDDLSNVLVGVEASMTARVAKTGDGTIKTAPQRIIGKLPAALPQIEEVIEPASFTCRSDCGFLHKIGKDRSERLEIGPAKLRDIVIVRQKYVCRTCTDGVAQAPA
jgi:transposase